MNKIKSVNLMVTNLCNSRCNMCNIWQSTNKEELNLALLQKAFSWPQLSEVEDLSISGGEPFLRVDVEELAISMIKLNPKLKMLFLNTNGLMPDKVLKLAKNLLAESKKINSSLQIFFSVSIEGPKDIHEKIRGRSYDLAMQTILLLLPLSSANFKVMMSMTVQRANADFIEQTRNIADSLACNFSFRFADFTDNYYNNSASYNIALNKNESVAVLDRVKHMFTEDPFFKVLYNHVCFGKNEVMIGQNNDLICQAGKLFIFIKSDGNIYPCIYSNQIIGSLATGLKDFTLNRLSKCPCCTECHIYPMLIYSGNN